MQGLDLIHHEHQELVRLTDVVIQAVESDAGIEQIAAARQALGQLVIRHVANKQAIITATLLASGEAAHHQLARRFTEDLMKLRGATSEHYGVWPMTRIAADRKGFVAAVRYQRRLLRARIAWEEHAAFPIVAELLESSAPARKRAGWIK